jgi:alpha-1,4-digalacturonate transport system substrate-binding protein
MKKINILTSVVIATMMATVTLAGCAQKKQEGSATSDSKPVTLNYVWFTDGIEGDVMKKLVSDYKAKKPNVTVNIVEVPFKDLNTKVRTMIAGGEAPALARITEPGTFFSNAINLSEYLGGTDAFSSQFIDALKPYYVKDNKDVLAAPMDVTANGLIYNKTLFNKAGIQVPTSADKAWTWDQIPDISKQLVEKGGAKYGMVVDNTPHRWSTLLYEFGGSLFNEDASKAVINNENGVKALDMFVKLHKEKVIPESVWLGSENSNTLFRSGTVGMHLSGNWMLSNYKDINDFEWGVTYLPKGTMNSSVPGAKFIMGFKGTKVEKETAELIKYLTSKEINSQYCQESLFMSPRKDSSELNYSFGKEMFKIFAEELKNTTPKAANDWSRSDLMPKITTDYKNNIIEAVQGKVTSKQALDKIAATADKAIAENKK